MSNISTKPDLESQAWPEDHRNNIKEQAEGHTKLLSLIKTMDRKEILDKVYFRDITPTDMQEIKNLHREWFPLDYPDSFYDKILLKRHVIALGCFV